MDKRIKITFVVDQADVDKKWSLNDLKKFSARCQLRVIVRKFCMFERGVLTWLA